MADDDVDDDDDDDDVDNVDNINDHNLPPHVGKRNDCCDETMLEEEGTVADSVAIHTTIKQITGRGDKTRVTGDTTRRHNEGDGRHNNGNDDGDRRQHGDGKGQQGGRRYNDGDGRQTRQHDKGDARLTTTRLDILMLAED